MERFFRSLKNEWVPATGYVSFSDAAHAITDYIVGYYSALRPHEYNGGFRSGDPRSFTPHCVARLLPVPDVLCRHSDLLRHAIQGVAADCSQPLNFQHGAHDPGPTEVGPVRPAIILTRIRRGNTVRTKKPLARLCACVVSGLRIPAPVL
ncbi:hypothetical protein JRT41CECX_JRT41CEC_01930 [Escherichia coli]|nr:hypothetical protein JRT41CECX_JRT41CEC_01930 [Escherichia coli]